jgi:hypothetical protein
MVAKYTADGTLPEKFDKGEMEKGEEKHMWE